MQRRKLCVTTNDIKRAPFDRFIDFLHNVACKNTNKITEEQYGGNQNFMPGLNNSSMLINLFSNAAYLLDQTLLQEPVQCFPFHCLFMRDGYDFDDSLLKMDRIGGSFTHLENELSDHLKAFKGQQLTEREKETFLYAKDLLLLFIYGILPDLEKYT